MKIKPRALLVWLALCLIWGTMWVFLKIALQDVAPFTFSAIRLTLTGVVLLPLVVARGTSFASLQANWKIILALSLFQIALPFGFNTWAVQHAPSSLVAILFSAHPLFVIVLAHFFVAGEAMTTRRLAGTLCGIAGVAAICWNQLAMTGAALPNGAGLSVADASGLSVIAVLLAALSGAVSNIIVKRNHQRVDAVANTALQMLLAGLSHFLPAFLLEQPLQTRFTWRAFGALLYLAIIGTATAFVLFYWLMKQIEITLVSFITIINTFVAAIFGWLVLNERLGLHTLTGGALIIVGLLLVILKSKEKPVDESAVQLT